MNNYKEKVCIFLVLGESLEIILLIRRFWTLNDTVCCAAVKYCIDLQINAHIQILEECDKALCRQLFNIHLTCSYEAFFCETGALPIRYTLIGRWLVYYWTVLNKSEVELVTKVFNVQKKCPVRGAWIKQIKLDLQQLEEEIKSMKIYAYKKVIKEKLHNNAFDFLEILKENHSKTENLTDYKLQNYIISKNISKEIVVLPQNAINPC